MSNKSHGLISSGWIFSGRWSTATTTHANPLFSWTHFIYIYQSFLTNAVMILFPICTICDIVAPNHNCVVDVVISWNVKKKEKGDDDDMVTWEKWHLGMFKAVFPTFYFFREWLAFRGFPQQNWEKERFPSKNAWHWRLLNAMELSRDPGCFPRQKSIVLRQTPPLKRSTALQ